MSINYGNNDINSSGNINTSGIIIAASGIFSNLSVAGTSVSISGHTHTSSNITDFNSSVSGLIPEIIYIRGNNLYGIKPNANNPSCFAYPIGGMVLGGTNNIVGISGLTYEGAYGVIVGGNYNTCSGSFSTIGNGTLNTIGLTSEYSAIIGGTSNNTNNYSGVFILGSNITANQSNTTFVENLIASATGNFSALQVNSTGVSISGHTHITSDITDFNNVVSGLLPTISNSGDNRVLTSTGSSTGATAESNLIFNNGILTVGNNTTADHTLNINSGPASSGSLGIYYGGDAPKLRGIIRHYGGASGLVIANQGSAGGDNQTNDILFQNAISGTLNYSTDADLVTRMIVKNDGKIGIGTSSPSGQLHVIGTGLFSQKVGIGNTSPSYSLDVTGTGNFSQNLLINGTGVSISGHTHSSDAISVTDLQLNNVVTNDTLTNVMYNIDIAFDNVYNNFSSYQPLLTNPITSPSGGTAGYIPKFTNSTNISDSIIYDNGTRIGIGTSTPSGKLHVIGTGLFSSRVGIGTNSPSSFLDVRSSGNPGLIVQSNNLENIFQYLKTDGSNLLRGYYDGSNFHHMFGSNVYYNFTGNGGIVLNGAGGANQNSLSLNNNFFIGCNSSSTAAPGNANIWGGPNAYATSGTQLTSTSPIAFTTWAWNGSNGYSITTSSYFKQTQLSANNGDARLGIIRASDNTEILSVNYLNGRVGVNNTNPSYALDVVGTGNFSQNLLVNGTGVSISGHSHTSSDISNFNSSVSGLLPTIANSGDNRILTSTGSTVGITAENNLTYDGSTLLVNSGNITAGNALGNYRIKVARTGVNASSLSIGAFTNEPSIEWSRNSTAGALRFEDTTTGSNVERMRINHNGLVGIGTTTPSGQLHVIGTGLFSQRVGIGTNSPSYILDVTGTGNFSQNLLVNGTGVSLSGHTHIFYSEIADALGDDPGSALTAIGAAAASHTHSSADITNFSSGVNSLVSGTYAPLTGTLNQFASTSSSQLATVINDETGTGSLVFNTSPAFSGIPTVPTATSGTNTTQIASTAFVRTEISNLVASAPAALDTLNELASALGNDANFSTTVTNNLASKASLSGATFTGTISGPSGVFSSGLNISNETASTIAGFDASKNVTSLSTATYPSLTELSYVKGATSAIQTQINNKQNTLTNPVTGTGIGNYSVKWTSSSGVGTGLLIDTGSRIGIAHNSPSGGLHIKNDAGQWSSFNYSPSLLIDGARNNGIGILDSSSSNPIAIVNNAGSLKISHMPAIGNTGTPPTDRLILDTSGNFVVGTSAITESTGRFGVTNGSSFLYACDSAYGTLTLGPRKANDGFSTVLIYPTGAKFGGGSRYWIHDYSHSVYNTTYYNGTSNQLLLSLTTGGDLSVSGDISSRGVLVKHKNIVSFSASDNMPPAASYATLDTRNSIMVLDFDAATTEYAIFPGIIPDAANLVSGLKVTINWTATTATTGSCVWQAEFKDMDDDLDAITWGTAVTGISTTNATNGTPSVATISLSSAQIDGLIAGDFFLLRIARSGASASDTLPGDAELINLEVETVI